MDILQKLQLADQFQQSLSESGIREAIAPSIQIETATTGVVNGQSAILAGTNNYLGLTFNKHCIQQSIQAVQRAGTGTTGSRLANGSYSEHMALEQEFSDLMGTKSTIVFNTGYVANLGTVATLVGPGDHIVLDSDCHSSIYEAAKLSGANIYRFKHNQVSDLNKKLSRLKKEIKRTLVITETLYSMMGDFSPLEEICNAVNNHGAYLMVDDAHSFGIMGKQGKGYIDALGVADKIDFITGTFSKSLGSIGGFMTSYKHDVSSLRTQIKSYMFTASSAPAVIASTRAALDILKAGDHLRKRLWKNANRVHSALTELGFELGAEASPVIAAIMPDSVAAVQAWRVLYEHGVYVNLVVPPGAPNNLSLLRCSISAAHTDEQITKIIDAYSNIPQQQNVVQISSQIMI